MLKRLGIFLGFLIVLYLIPLTWTAPLRNATVQLVKPGATYLVRQNVTFFNFVQSVRQISTLRSDKLQLEQQVSQLEQKLSDQQTVERENAALRQEVGVTGVTQQTKKALAHIVLIGDDPIDTTLTIDLGSSSGIKEDQAAIYQGALIGKVISVRQNSAVVRPVTSSESRIQVWLSDSREKGLLVGDGTSAHLSNITQGVKVADHSIIETSGLGGSLPQGILVGETGDLTSQKSDLSQSFAVKLSQDPLSIESVFILLTSN